MFDLQKERISGPPLPQSPGVCGQLAILGYFMQYPSALYLFYISMLLCCQGQRQVKNRVDTHGKPHQGA